MISRAERKILDMIEQGAITADDGLRLINAMGGTGLKDQAPTVGGAAINPNGNAARVSGEEIARIERLKRWWILPFGVGLLFTILGAVWMFMGYQAAGFGFGFWAAWLPLVLGIFILAVSFQASHGVWLHVRIRQKKSQSPSRIAFSMPIPVRLTQWFLRTFGGRVPGLRDQPIDELSAILETLSPEAPFYVHVNDDDDEAVEVLIG